MEPEADMSEDHDVIADELDELFASDDDGTFADDDDDGVETEND